MRLYIEIIIQPSPKRALVLSGQPTVASNSPLGQLTHREIDSSDWLSRTKSGALVV